MIDLRRVTTIRGLRNNNPRNIRISETPWQGKIPKSLNTDKNKAFEAMNKWVKEFYEVAKIALSDRPQLLESIGKLVKS